MRLRLVSASPTAPAICRTCHIHDSKACDECNRQACTHHRSEGRGLLGPYVVCFVCVRGDELEMCL